MNGVAAAERGVHSRQAVGEVAVAYPLTPQQLRAAVIESGCGEVKAPPEVSIIEHADPIKGQGPTKTKKYAAGAAAAVQLLASICAVAQAQPGSDGEAAAPAAVSAFTVDLRILYRLLKCATITTACTDNAPIMHRPPARPPAHHHHRPTVAESASRPPRACPSPRASRSPSASSSCSSW